MASTIKNIGSFELTGTKMVIGDPCYCESESWLCLILDNCVPGTWNAAVRISDEGYFGKRVAVLIVWKDGEDVPPLSKLRVGMRTVPAKFIRADGGVDVDSGQAGFFDMAHCGDSKVIDPEKFAYDFSHGWEDHSLWYKACCDATLSRLAGVIPYGAVASSGFGDGGYFAGYHTNREHQTDMAFISFI